jgi:signal peptidase
MMLFKTTREEPDEDEEPKAVASPPKSRAGEGGPSERPGDGGRGTEPGSHRHRHRRRHDEEEEEDDEEEIKTSRKETAKELLRDIAIAVVILIIFIGSIWAYTGNWPPVVVVQSGSMMHGTDSEVGVIDTGDLVLVKSIDGKSDITTYFEGKEKDYQSYDEYGDVIVYKKNGEDPDRVTPVIHRVLFWLEFNAAATVADPDPSAGHFNIPELGMEDVTGEVVIDTNFPSYAVNEKDGPLIVNLNRIYGLMRADPHSGYVTKGDNNPIGNIDQYSTSTPVKVEWIIGKARGEMPWFGLIKLYASGSIDGEPPPSSVNMLILTLAVIIIVPISLEMAYSVYVNQKKARDEEEEEAEERRDRHRRGGGGRGKEPRSGHPPPLSRRGGFQPPEEKR